MFEDEGDRIKVLSHVLRLMAGASVAIGVVSTFAGTGVVSGDCWYVIRDASDSLSFKEAFFDESTGVSSIKLEGAVVAVVSV